MGALAASTCSGENVYETLDPNQTQLDVQFGRLLGLLKDHNLTNDTVILYTADNGPHQGAERTNFRWPTMQLRQCKASIFEGGIRVPGIMHAPGLIQSHINVTTPM